MTLGHHLRAVSVPLRGKYRGESQTDFLGKIERFSVSVPLRGKYRGESLMVQPSLRVALMMFPSPCGVNIVANCSFMGWTAL